MGDHLFNPGMQRLNDPAGRLHDALSSLSELIDDPLLRGGQLRPVLDLDGDVIVVLDDASEAKAEHLTVNVFVILGHDAAGGQVLLADLMMPPTGLALHTARLSSLRIKIVANRRHDAGELGTKRNG